MFVVSAGLVYVVLARRRDESLFDDPYYWLGLLVHVVLVVTVANGSTAGWALLTGSATLALLWWLLQMGSGTYDVVCAVLLAAALGALFAPPLLRYVWRRG